MSWATTDGQFREEGLHGPNHQGELTVYGTYTAMSSEIVASKDSNKVHHLVMYWTAKEIDSLSKYRYNHCYEVPELDIASQGVIPVTLYGTGDELANKLYLVPTNNAAFVKFGFTDFMKVSYVDGNIQYDATDGNYYAVRAYSGNGGTEYFALARQVQILSSNWITAQSPSVRQNMTRVNEIADHTTQHNNDDGAWYQGSRVICGSEDSPYDLYFYYNRDRYTITYMAPSNNITTDNEVTLGTITLPYGAMVTQEKYGFNLYYQDKNTDSKYPWTAATPEVSVCPDRAANGTAVWQFRGWGLGPAGLNMQWTMNKDAQAEAQAGDAFAIAGNLRLYAIWETPSYDVTFHLAGGMVGTSSKSIVEQIPANTRYSASGIIPRPMRTGYTLRGWYVADENGTKTEPEVPFDFDQIISENKHAVAEWSSVTNQTFSYTVYYVTDNPLDADKTKETVNIAGNEITPAPDGAYYVLGKEAHPDENFVDNMVLNLSAAKMDGYLPVITIKTLEPVANGSYNVIFYYNQPVSYSHRVQFVLAGTENTEKIMVKSLEVQADQAVMTPQSAAVQELLQKGYALVNKVGDGYTQVTAAENLTWIDTDGTPKKVATLTGENIPELVTYLVQPIPYTITYRNAEDAPFNASGALTAVTADKNTSVAAANGKNPTLYTTRDTFTAKNPARVYDNGKWYRFSHWSLYGTTTEPGGTVNQYPTLTVEAGSVGNLTFIANWVEVTDVGSLTVSKTVAGNAGEKDRDWSFAVYFDDNNMTGSFSGIWFQNGKASFSLKDGGSKTFDGLPAGLTYRVDEAEANQDGYVTEKEDTGNGVIAAAGSTVAFTNTKNEFGSLTVSKTVAGNAGEQDRDFTFTVTLQGAIVDGVFGNMPFANSVATFTLRHGQSKTAVDLPAGITYTVTETEADQDGYATTKTGDTGTIVKDATVTAAFTNTKNEYGSLTVSKTVTGNASDKNQMFTFRVYLVAGENAPVSESYSYTGSSVEGVAAPANGTLMLTNGVGTITLKHGQSITINGILAGIDYTVMETAVEGYVTTQTGDTGTIVKDATVAAAFTNTKNEYGSLTVSKTVAGNVGEKDREFEFHVALADGVNAKTAETYRYTGSSTVDGVAAPADGTLTLTDGAGTITLKHGQSITIDGILTGTGYTVTETAAEGYVTTVAGSANGQINKNGSTAAFTNTKDEFGSLTVSKTVAGNAGEQDRSFAFTVSLENAAGEPVSGTFGGVTFTDGKTAFALKHGQSITINDIPANTAYTVEEAAVDGYVTTVNTVTSRVAAGVMTKAGAQFSFTNTKNEYGSLTVSKVVAGDAGETDRDFHFTVTLNRAENGKFGDLEFVNGVAAFTLRHGQSKTGRNLPAGVTYTVTEQEADQDDYVTTKTGDSGVIENNRTANAVFTNTKNHPLPPPNTHVTISKAVTGNAGEKDREFHFTMTLSDRTISGEFGQLTFADGVASFTLKDGQSLTATQIPVGVTCQVTEQEANQDDYVTTVTGATVTLVQNQTAVAEFVNERNYYGSLKVSKTVTGEGAETDRAFAFTVRLSDQSISGAYGGMAFTDGSATFTLKHGESLTASNLPAGITYTVTEAAAEDYTASAANAEGTIEKDVTAEVSFTNTKNQYGSLTVSKTVAGEGADQAMGFSFTVTLSDKTINGVYGDMTFTGGVARIALKHGEHKTAAGLPVGVAYTVREDRTEGYTSSAANADGTIAKGVAAEAAFVNTKDAVDPGLETGKLTVNKKVTGLGGEKYRNFTFVVTLDDKAIQGQYGDMFFVDGKAVFTLRHDQSVTAEGLPAGVHYSVREEDNDGYRVTKSGDTGVIEAEKTAGAWFINYRSFLDDQPKTGDETKLELWLALMGISFFGAISCVWVSVRKKKKGKYSK